MNQYPTTHSSGSQPLTLDAAGQRLAQRLLQSLDNIPDSTQQHLRAARAQAVDRRRQLLAEQAQAVLRPAALGPSGHSWFEQHTSAWHLLGNIGMMLVLLVGLWTIDSLESDQFINNAAEIDNLLLTDDLPPAAYLDPGFKHFLKLSFPSDER